MGGRPLLKRHVAEAGLAPCDDGQLEILEGTTHWLHIEQPERINRNMLSVLAARRQPSP